MNPWVISEYPEGVRLLRAAECEPQAVQWLWRHWLPRAAITIVAGMPGTGKTTLALSIASIVSGVGSWPDGTGCAEPGNVVIWSGEDDIQATLLPRLIAMGADRDRIHFVTQIHDRGRFREFDPSTDIRQLMMKIAEIGGARLVIIDPIMSAVAGDAHRANEVRRDLHDLVVLARSDVAVVGISHFSKGGAKTAQNPLDRVIGSQAFAALARVVLVTARRSGADERVLARAKSNLGPDGGGFEYLVESLAIPPSIETSRVVWGDAVDGDAQEILNQAEQATRPPSRMEEAKEFLIGTLVGHSRLPSVRVFELAAAAGHSASTVNRAKVELQIRVEKDGNGGWYWRL
ncbi:AAA family ATPase [Castellaniella ginsengisoli]|uniref:AAA family ATPase n=1 Tax=Castellaniella ginsengisoli TaxID=546114 RepID=A0AB39CZH7_9BURK